MARKAGCRPTCWREKAVARPSWSCSTDPRHGRPWCAHASGGRKKFSLRLNNLKAASSNASVTQTTTHHETHPFPPRAGHCSWFRDPHHRLRRPRMWPPCRELPAVRQAGLRRVSNLRIRPLRKSRRPLGHPAPELLLQRVQSAPVVRSRAWPRSRSQLAEPLLIPAS